MASDASEATSSSGPVTTPSPDDASGYGLTLTLIGAVLLALAYYGVVAIQGSHRLGQALPEPFYFLALAFLFVVELLNSRQRGLVGLARAIAFTAVYGALFVFAVEGGAYLWANPNVALEGYVGVTVLAIALVASALVYVGYLAVLEADGGSA
ncbi:hypothetical protein ACFOZ7_18715 [Natribaculum luteum]|uniref:Uncharacterized protein n=1 Tax=Natribaculum luteum TaxID=1586232 RepID=A0ABD5P3N5_9EURY|nr:hypothetical protein [Natribaculum luteum]